MYMIYDIYQSLTKKRNGNHCRRPLHNSWKWTKDKFHQSSYCTHLQLVMFLQEGGISAVGGTGSTYTFYGPEELWCLSRVESSCANSFGELWVLDFQTWQQTNSRKMAIGWRDQWTFKPHKSRSLCLQVWLRTSWRRLGRESMEA